MRKNLRMRKKFAAVGCAAALCAANIVSMPVPVQAATINVDGNPQEWKDISFLSSNTPEVAGWKVAKDDSYLYFYVSQNGGNAWGLPMTNTHIDIRYDSNRQDRSGAIYFTPMMQAVKDAYYGDVSDTQVAFIPSQEANKYDIEFAIPKSFFPEETFTIQYCGAEIKNADIPDITSMDEAVEEDAVYNGIKIDGTFTDWNAVEKTDLDREAVVQTAVVFDGDYFYIYLKENFEGAAAWSGEREDGKFTIHTDSGRDTIFKLNTNSIEGIKNATVAHSNLQYEIAIPASAIKPYKQTVSFGYYMEDTMLIENIANLRETEEETKDRTFNGIQYDGAYSDWDYYPHHLIEYATNGTHDASDAEGALYTKDTTLYGHVRVLIDKKGNNEFSPFCIRINESEKTTLNFRLCFADEDGELNLDPSSIDNLEAGTYELYIRDYQDGSTINNVNNPECPVYGKAYITLRKTANGSFISDEMEYQIDLKKVAAHFNMDDTDMKLIQAQYIEIGDEWISIGGTSTGTWLGISLCVAVVLGVLVYRKRKSKVAA